MSDVIISENWKVYYYFSWKGKWLNVTIVSQNLNCIEEFENCIIKKSVLLSLVLRYPNYNFKGAKSAISELLLKSAVAQNLLKNPRANLALKSNCVIYKCRIQVKNTAIHYKTLILLEMLQSEIDKYRRVQLFK